MHGDIYVVCGYFLELHIDALWSSNLAETVLECITISCNWDLRVKLKQLIIGIENT